MGIVLSIWMGLCYTIRDFRLEDLREPGGFRIVHRIDSSCTDSGAVVFTLQKSETWRNENEE